MFRELNPILHNQLRLSIMSLLMQHTQIEFLDIEKWTEASKGNISVQIKKLEAEKYLEVEKKFIQNYPKTICKITAQGKRAFNQYFQDIQTYIKK